MKELFLKTLKEKRPHLLDSKSFDATALNSVSELFNTIEFNNFIRLRSEFCEGLLFESIDPHPARYYYIISDFHLLTSNQIVDVVQQDDFYLFPQNNLLPFFTSGEGDYLAVNLKELKNKNFNTKIYLCSNKHPELGFIIPYYDSINSMFRTNIECYNRKAYLIENDGSLDIDFDLFDDIHCDYNPKSEFWE